MVQLRIWAVLSALLAVSLGDSTTTANVIGDEYSVITQPLEEVLQLQPGKTKNDVNGITDAIEEIVDAYNNLMVNINDPLKRKMTKVVINHNKTEEVVFRKRNRNLQGADERNLGSKTLYKYVRITLAVSGVCFKCVNGVKLVNDIHGRRRVLSAGQTPTISQIVTEQNTLISSSSNDVVEKVSALRVAAVILAVEATTAETNAKLHEEYVKELEEKAKKEEQKVSTAKSDTQQSWERAYKYNPISSRRVSYAQTKLGVFFDRVFDKLGDIKAEIAAAKVQLAAMRAKAKQLRAAANSADLFALQAEQQAANEAKAKNKANADKSASVKTNARFIDATFDSSLRACQM